MVIALNIEQRRLRLLNHEGQAYCFKIRTSRKTMSIVSGSHNTSWRAVFPWRESGTSTSPLPTLHNRNKKLAQTTVAKMSSAYTASHWLKCVSFVQFDLVPYFAIFQCQLAASMPISLQLHRTLQFLHHLVKDAFVVVEDTTRLSKQYSRTFIKQFS